MNQVAVVICNYNKKDFVLDCIESVLASSFKDFDLVVVDNASTDGSIEAIEDKYGSKLTLLVNEENLGGSGGFNRGMQFAMDEGRYRYIHLIDNDVVADCNAIGELFNFMEVYTETGVCGSLICKAQARSQIQDYGANIDYINFSVLPLFNGKVIRDDLPGYVECDYVAACSAMYRTSALKKTGLIDKDYFLYWDDMALCAEMRLHGYPIFACSKSVVWHYGSYGIGTAFSRYYFFRNKIYYFVKYLDDRQYDLLCANIVNRLFRMFAVNRDNPGYIENYFHALNDALNNVRGKAEPHKLIQYETSNETLAKAFEGKQSILIVGDCNELDVYGIVSKIKSVSEATIYIFKDTIDIPAENDIRYTNNPDGSYDIVVQICNHILDEKNYDRSKLYIDKYSNQILCKEDFEFYENLEVHRDFFKTMYYGFIKSKLDALRERIGKTGIV